MRRAAKAEGLPDNVGFKIDAVPRVTHDFWVTIEGKRYDAGDLLETLYAVDGDDVEVDRNPGEMLVRLGVLESLGSRRWYSGASKGPNYRVFLDALENGVSMARKRLKAEAG